MFRKLWTLVFSLFFVCSLAEAETRYEVEVNIASQIVTVFRGSERTEENVARQMICSTGEHNSTPRGTFKVTTRRCDRKEWYYIKSFRAYVQYSVRFYNDILFHSVPCKSRNADDFDLEALAGMGSPVSHGCVRLYREDAKWLAENVEDGSKVHVFDGSDAQTELHDLLMTQGAYIPEEWNSYREFLGYSEDESVISRSSDAEQIEVLQNELRRAGYYAGEIDGEYSAETRSAVREAQRAMGAYGSGLADAGLRRALAENRVPAGARVTLSEGDSGLSVRALQEALGSLGYYTGEADGVFSEALSEAVRLYRLVRKLGDSARAEEDIQQKIREEAKERPLSEGETMTAGPVECQMASITGGVVLALRDRASTKGEILRYLKGGEEEYEIIVLEQPSAEWARVRVDDAEGYVLAAYLEVTAGVEYREVRTMAADE